jgi:hypothetical protein
MSPRASGTHGTGTEVWLQAGPCTLRVTGDGAGDAPVIARQLGARRLPHPAPGTTPDVTVDVAPLDDRPRPLIGAREYAIDDGGLVVLRGPGKRPIELLVPFDDLGASPTLRCPPGSAPLPLLVAVLNVSALAAGVLPVHAAAFDLDGRGVLVTGWSKSGKTETLLAFASRGARYVGDEWVYLHGDGSMTGLPEPMRVWSWHLDQLGDHRPKLPTATRTKLAVLDAATAGGGSLDRRLPGTLRRLRHLLADQRNVRVSPDTLLPRTGPVPLDVIVLTESHERGGIAVEEVDSADVAARVATMLPGERAGLLDAYRAFRYGLPERRSTLLDGAEERERELLAERLAGRPALRVRHPYPFRFDELAATLGPWLRGS